MIMSRIMITMERQRHGGLPPPWRPDPLVGRNPSDVLMNFQRPAHHGITNAKVKRFTFFLASPIPAPYPAAQRPEPTVDTKKETTCPD